MAAPIERALESSRGSRRAPLFPLSRREWAWLALGSLIFAAAFCYPLLCEIGYQGPGHWGWINLPPVSAHLTRLPECGDWDSFEQLRWVAWASVAHFHQLPFWNPYKCGGMPLLANPETSIVTPFFLIYFVFGFGAGLIAELVLHLWVAVTGSYLLGRVLRFSPLAAMVGAAVFAGSSWYYLHAAVGHLNFLSAAYLPWTAAFLIIAIERHSLFAAALCGLFVALTFNEGNYSSIFAVLLVGILALTYSMVRMSLRPLLFGGAAGGFAAGFAAMKLIPALELLRSHPRADYGPEWHTFRMMLVYVFSRDQDLYRTSVSMWGFHEYGAFVSIAFALLAVAGVSGSWRVLVPWLIALVVFFQLAMGNTQPYSLITYAERLPLANNFHLPSRFIIPATLCAGVIAALGAERIGIAFGRWGRAVVAVLLAVGIVDSWLVSTPNLRYAFQAVHGPRPPLAEFHQVWIDNPQSLIQMAIANEGSLHAPGYGQYEFGQHVIAMNQPGYRGEYYLRGGGNVAQVYWSPNQMEFHVDAPAETTLIINQNFYPGWRLVDSPGTVIDYDGLLAVQVPQGSHPIKLRYRPGHFTASAALTLLSMLCAIALARRELRRW